MLPTAALLSLALTAGTLQASPVDQPVRPRSPASPPAGGFSLPISKRSGFPDRANNEVDLEWVLRVRDRAALKYTATLPKGALEARSLVKRQSKGNETLDNLYNEYGLWAGNITIGNQPFEVDFDTGSADLWVPSSSCRTTGCQGHQTYTPGSSAKLESGSFSITYADESTTNGPVYSDTVTLAGGSIVVQNQFFSPVINSSASFSAKASGRSDGLSGLAPPATANIAGGMTLFESMIAQNQLNSTLFTFSLSAFGPSSINFGYIDNSLYTGSITYADIISLTSSSATASSSAYYFWQIELSALPSVGGQAISVASTYASDAIIDSGTSLAYGPAQAVAAIYARIPGAVSATTLLGRSYDGSYVYPCSQPANVSFSFSGQQFQINSYNNNLGYVPKTSPLMCLGALSAMDSIGTRGSFLLGDIFMLSQFVVFEQTSTSGAGRVGFAKSAIDYDAIAIAAGTTTSHTASRTASATATSSPRASATGGTTSSASRSSKAPGVAIVLGALSVAAGLL